MTRVLADDVEVLVERAFPVHLAVVAEVELGAQAVEDRLAVAICAWVLRRAAERRGSGGGVPGSGIHPAAPGTGSGARAARTSSAARAAGVARAGGAGRGECCRAALAYPVGPVKFKGGTGPRARATAFRATAFYVPLFPLPSEVAAAPTLAPFSRFKLTGSPWAGGGTSPRNNRLRLAGAARPVAVDPRGRPGRGRVLHGTGDTSHAEYARAGRGRGGRVRRGRLVPTGWYQLSVAKSSDGNLRVETTVDTNKVVKDVGDGAKHLGELAGNQLDKVQKDAKAGPQPTAGTPPARSPRRRPSKSPEGGCSARTSPRRARESSSLRVSGPRVRTRTLNLRRPRRVHPRRGRFFVPHAW